MARNNFSFSNLEEPLSTNSWTDEHPVTPRLHINADVYDMHIHTTSYVEVAHAGSSHGCDNTCMQHANSLSIYASAVVPGLSAQDRHISSLFGLAHMSHMLSTICPAHTLSYIHATVFRSGGIQRGKKTASMPSLPTKHSLLHAAHVLRNAPQ